MERDLLEEHKALWAVLRASPGAGRPSVAEQRAIVDAIAVGSGRHIQRYIVIAPRNPHLGRLHPDLEEAAALSREGIELTIVVTDLGSLAPTRRKSMTALVELLIAGVVLMDRTGELRPSQSTREFALAYRSAMVVEKALSARSRRTAP